MSTKFGAQSKQVAKSAIEINTTILTENSDAPLSKRLETYLA